MGSLVDALVIDAVKEESNGVFVGEPIALDAGLARLALQVGSRSNFTRPEVASGERHSFNGAVDVCDQTLLNELDDVQYGFGEAVLVGRPFEKRELGKGPIDLGDVDQGALLVEGGVIKIVPEGGVLVVTVTLVLVAARAGRRFEIIPSGGAEGGEGVV